MVTISSSDVGMAILGGLLIGIATSLHLFLKGRVTGMSGIYYSLLTQEQDSFYWKLSLVSGMFFASSVMYLSANYGEIGGTSSSIFDEASENVGGLSFIGYYMGGLLVGVGTKMGNGCTSGHGVCGMPRWSKRSWVSVITFMCTGFGIATLRYHTRFWENSQGKQLIQETNFQDNSVAILFISLLIFFLDIYIVRNQKFQVLDNVITFFVGGIFTTGLGFGGMLKRRKIYNFLAIQENWDPQLLILFATAVTFNIVTFHLIINVRQKPLLAEKLAVPSPSNPIDFKLVLGAALFGVGWGIGGLCPGPALALFTQFTLQVGLVWFFGFSVGQILAARVDNLILDSPEVKRQILSELEFKKIASTAEQDQKQVDNQVVVPLSN